MKKILCAILIAVFAFAISPVNVQAQTVIKSYNKYVLAGTADTTTFQNVGSKLSSLQYTVTKDTGTVAGKVYLEVTTNGKYKIIDSLTLANNTTDQSLFHLPTKTYYLTYRFRTVPTGNWSCTIKASGIRRTDE